MGLNTRGETVAGAKTETSTHKKHHQTQPQKPEAPNVKLYKPASEKEVVTTKKQTASTEALIARQLNARPAW